MISFGLCSFPMGIFSMFFNCNRCDASLGDPDLFMCFFFFSQFFNINKRVPQTARRPSQNSQSCRMEISRDIRRCWRRIGNISSIFSSNCTTIKISNMISRCRDGIKSKITSKQSPSRIRQTPRTLTTTLTSKMTVKKWRWMTTMNTR